MCTIPVRSRACAREIADVTTECFFACARTASLALTITSGFSIAPAMVLRPLEADLGQMHPGEGDRAVLRGPRRLGRPGRRFFNVEGQPHLEGHTATLCGPDCRSRWSYGLQGPLQRRGVALRLSAKPRSMSPLRSEAERREKAYQ